MNTLPPVAVKVKPADSSTVPAISIIAAADDYPIIPDDVLDAMEAESIAYAGMMAGLYD